jgi:TIR domain
MSERIFLSYASEYERCVMSCAKDICSAGHEVWFDRFGLPPGSNLFNKIVDDLSKCSQFVLFSSPIALQSDWVRMECAIAVALDIKISIVCLETCEPVDTVFGPAWNDKTKILCYDLRAGHNVSPNWERFISTLDRNKIVAGLPQESFDENDWRVKWKQFKLPFAQAQLAWDEYQRVIGHVGNLAELDAVLGFFSQTGSNPEQIANLARKFLKKYHCFRLDRYKKWYDFIERPETQLSTDILMDNKHDFSLRMTATEPESIIEWFERFRSRSGHGISQDISWCHAVSASQGVRYE